jgi:hypothetical protein
MGNRIRIVKRYKNTSPKAGIEEVDIIEIEDGADGAARFVTAINANPNHEFEIIDYEAALITKIERPEVITNPTGGGTGKVLLPGKDF